MASTPWYALGETQGFLWTPTNTHAHSGIDLGTADGRPITAPFDGTEISHGVEPWGGQENELIKDSSGNYEVLSWLHMEQETPLAPGTPIHAGDLLGYSGTPPAGYGNGPHIHFERTYGKTPPYMGYNPWYPTKTSFPETPQPILDQLKASGEGGTFGAPASATGTLSLPVVSLTGADPVGIGAAFTGFESAIGTDIGNVQKTVADGFKRAGVFVIGLVLAIVGLLIIFQPQAEDIKQDLAGMTKAIGGAITGAGKSGGAAASGGLADLAEVAA